MSASEDAAVDPALLAVIERYIDALNRRDLEGVRNAFHFPHVLFAGGQVTYYASRSDLSFDAFDARVVAQNWSRSSWDGHRVVLSDPAKVHLDVWFTRWRGDGSAIGQHHSLYILTRLVGRWGIQARSSYG